MSEAERYHSAALRMLLDRAGDLAHPEKKVEAEHVLGAMLELVPAHRTPSGPARPAGIVLFDAGLRWDKQTRQRLGIMSPEERAEVAERAELARLKAKYEGGAA